MRKVSIVIELEDDEQSAELELEMNSMFHVLSWSNLQNTDDIQEDPIYKKLRKNRKLAQKLEYEYVDKNN
tara:strand:+ start:485 stop:694 length:210 start_codon:yes stop_codon:yes gene_type:complete